MLNPVKKKFLLLGRTGLLGSAFREVFEAQEIDFIAPSRKELDLLNEKEVRKFFEEFEFDYVINASGYNFVSTAGISEETMKMCFNLNAGVPRLITEMLFLQKERNSVSPALGKLVQFSSDYVFDGFNPNGYDENAETNPLNVYGQSKVLGEEYVLEDEVNSIFRISWLFGPGGNNFLIKILEQYAEMGNVEVVNDQFGKPTYTYDVVEAVLNSLDRRGIFHCPNETVFNWSGFAKYALQKKYNLPKIKEISWRDFLGGVRRPENSVLLNTKLPLLRSGKEAIDDYLSKIL